MSRTFSERILSWGSQNFGDFPWRRRRSPFETLIAELLLRRTTATAAARNYEDFLEKFPSLEAIASAPHNELVIALSGLGLQNQRARDAKRLANWLLLRHGGRIPREMESLLATPGLGRYSAAAVLSFGYGIPAAIVDANVERVLTRVFGGSLPPRPTEIVLSDLARSLMPEDRHQEYNYGLLDLGRQVCRYIDPRCNECPLLSVCDHFEAQHGRRCEKEGADISVGALSKLTQIRLERGLSLARLAEAAKVSKLTIIRIEAGRVSPRIATIETLARALQVSPEVLHDDTSSSHERSR